MNVIRDTESNFSLRVCELLANSSLFDPQVEERTRAILLEVATNGDRALLEYTSRFDGATLTADRLAVTQAELMAASLQADDSLREDLIAAVIKERSPTGVASFRIGVEDSRERKSELNKSTLCTHRSLWRNHGNAVVESKDNCRRAVDRSRRSNTRQSSRVVEV